VTGELPKIVHKEGEHAFFIFICVSTRHTLHPALLCAWQQNGNGRDAVIPSPEVGERGLDYS
jgi:hypothetical protein